MLWIGAAALLAPIQYVPAGEDREFIVGGRKRLARIVAPARKTDHPPVVFSFHGSGGKAYYAVDEYAIHKFWPEALVYYAQGLPGRNGVTTWSTRDLAFFDALRADALHRFSADTRAMFVHGYSTGANFACDLWAARGKGLRGFALVSGGRFGASWPKKPVLLSYGTLEPGAKALRRLGEILKQCLPDAIVLPHEGGHTYPQALNERIAKFLKASG